MPRRFGDKLRLLRVEHHLTQAELARQLGLATHSHVSYLERGKSAPSLEIAVRVANTFRITTDYVLQDTIPVYPVPTSALKDFIPAAIEHFGPQLRRLRILRGFTQSEMADQLAPITQAHMSYLESGSKSPSIDMVLRCAEVFDVSCDDLLRENNGHTSSV